MFTVKINDICVPGRGVKTEGVERWKWKIFLYLDLGRVCKPLIEAR